MEEVFLTVAHMSEEEEQAKRQAEGNGKQAKWEL